MEFGPTVAILDIVARLTANGAVTHLESQAGSTMVVPRLLITDDDLAVRRAIADVFRGLEFHVSLASDGDEAIEMIETSKIHLILIDVHMPRVSGLEVMRHVRSQNSIVPFILMSGAVDESIEREAHEMRVYRVLSKPLRALTVRQTVMHGLRDAYGWKVG